MDNSILERIDKLNNFLDDYEMFVLVYDLNSENNSEYEKAMQYYFENIQIKICNNYRELETILRDFRHKICTLIFNKNKTNGEYFEIRKDKKFKLIEINSDKINHLQIKDKIEKLIYNITEEYEGGIECSIH